MAAIEAVARPSLLSIVTAQTGVSQQMVGRVELTATVMCHTHTPAELQLNRPQSLAADNVVGVVDHRQSSERRQYK